MRAMVVEDEPLVARAIVRVLKSLGFDVVASVSDGSCALDEVCSRDSERALDLIVCDGDLPGLNGREFHDQLSEEMQKRCIFFTGDHAELFEGLPNPVVMKPDWDALKLAVTSQAGVRIV